MAFGLWKIVNPIVAAQSAIWRQKRQQQTMILFCWIVDKRILKIALNAGADCSNYT